MKTNEFIGWLLALSVAYIEGWARSYIVLTPPVSSTEYTVGLNRFSEVLFFFLARPLPPPPSTTLPFLAAPVPLAPQLAYLVM